MAHYQNGKLYKVVNSENSIVYIGSTTKHYLCERMGCHRSRAKNKTSDFYTAMRAIGIDKFSIELIKLYPCDSKAELEAAEGRQMKRYLKKGIELYNSTIDGEVSDATKLKMSKAQTGKVVSDATKLKMSKAQTGKVVSDATKLKMTGSNNSNFKRGCISFNKRMQSWRFTWQENIKRQTKSFSISKYGESEAKTKAIAVQDSIYPQ
jgi:hypothetical protein